MARNAQSSDIVEGLERVFANFPLPSEEQPFNKPIEFYQAITKDNQSVFYRQIERLRTVYRDACPGFESYQMLPRQLVVGLCALSVLDYIQNRLCLWESSKSRLLKLSLHDEVIASVNRFFKNNMNNPWFATNNPLLDKRLQMIKSLYAMQRPTLITNGYRSLIAIGTTSLRILILYPQLALDLLSWPFVNLEPFGMLHLLEPFVFGDFTKNDIAWYSTIIDSEPVIKKRLEDQYKIPKTPLGNRIDGFLRLHGCKALYVLSSKKDALLNPLHRPLIKIFEDQECLESGLFKTLVLACGNQFRGKIKLIIRGTTADRTLYTIDSFASNAHQNIKNVSNQFCKLKYIFPNTLRNPQSISYCSDALKLDHNEKNKNTDNQIQLFTMDVIGSNPVANRQFFHLRRAPSLQVRETLHYFNYHLDKLSDMDNQSYMEANLFQPGLLLDELDGEHHDDILQLIDDFVSAGLQHHLAHDQCTQASLFFIRMAYLVYDYAARYESPQAKAMLEQLLQRLTSLLELNKDNLPAIKLSLHQYQFLTAMSRLSQDPELDNNARENLIAQALPSYFYMNSSNNQSAQLDTATLFDLDCSKSNFRHVIQACSPDFMKTVVLQLVKQLAQRDVILNGDISYFVYPVLAGQRQFFVNVMSGLIFNDKGLSLTATPLKVIEYISKHYPDSDVPAVCFVNDKATVYDIGVPDPIFRYKTQGSQVSIEKKWTVNGLEQWYTLNIIKPIIDDLPQILRQKGTHFWTNHPQSDTLLITEHQRPIYKYDTTTHTFKQLDVNGDENGYTLCLGQTWLHELFSIFDSYKFITVINDRKPAGYIQQVRSLLVKAQNTGCFKIELSRYGLTVLARNENNRWAFRLQNQPTHQLVTDTTTGSCLKLPGLPYVAALIFEEDNTKQRRCYIPVQAFVAVNERSPDSEFYHVKHDITACIAESIVKKELSSVGETDWKYTHSERYRIFPLDNNSNPQPETSNDALYLCYIYLCNHKPDLAWAVLDDAARRLGGLSGSIQDISLLQMIVQELPYVVDGTYNKAPIETPPYIACKLKALAMLTRALTPGRTIVFPNQLLDKNSPDVLYKNACMEKDQNFYHDLNTAIHRLYSRYQSMYQDITHGFNLPDEQRLQLLDYYYFNLPGVEPKAMGALGFEQKRLRLKMLIKENVALEAEKQFRGKLPLAYEKRQQEIKAVLEQEKAIRGHHVDLVLRRVNYAIQPGCRQIVLPLEPPLTYNLTSVPTSRELRLAIDDLKDNVEPTIFLSNFPVYFRLLIAPSDRVLRKKLVDFCYLYLLTHRHVPLINQNSTAYLCNILYRIDCCFSLFMKGLSLISPLTDAVSSLLPSVTIPFNTLFTLAESLPDPVMEIYEACDQYSVVLPLNSQAWAQEMPIPGRLMISKQSIKLSYFTFEKLLDQCQLDPARKTEFQHQAQAYREQTKLFGSAPIDAINDFAAERRAGAEQANALQEMQTIAKQLLSKKTDRKLLQEKAQEFIDSLSDITSKQLKIALELANSGFEATPKEVLRKELALRCEMRVSLTAENILALYFKADKTLYALETGLPEDKINRLHDYVTRFISLSVRQQALQRFVNNIAQLVDTSSASAMQLTAHELLTEDLVDYKTEPVLALFQYYENVLLRPQQMFAIKRLIDTTDGYSCAEVVEKIIMGGGKSKVILPLLAKIKATGTNLVVVEVPRGLFETNCADLSNTSGRLFDQKPIPFDFSRESNCSPQSLDFLYSRLIDVIVRKDYVITTGDAVQSLELKYLELLLQSAPVNKAENLTWKQQVAGLDKLVNLFRTRADAVIDEVHQALLLKKKLNYTLGDVRSMPYMVIKKTIALYEFFEKIPLINLPGYAKAQDKSFADLLENNQLLIHDEDWRAAFQHMAHLLVTHPNSPLRPEIEQMMPSMTDEDSDQLCHYLMDTNADNIIDVPACVLGCNANARNVFAHFKEQVSQLLFLTLRRNLNEHYGASRLHPDTDIAIPYATNNEPSERSRFGNNSPYARLLAS